MNLGYNLKTRADLLEMDETYVRAMRNDPDAAAFLNKFNEEFVNASFEKNNKKNLHKKKAQKKDSYDRNNARNRCIYTRERAQGTLNYVEDLLADDKFIDKTIDNENEMIDALDHDLAVKKLNNLSNRSKKSDNSTDS